MAISIPETISARAIDDRAARGRARARLNRAMKVVRRTHLYAGLLLTPWVFLYGATAILFNHPDLLSDQGFKYIRPADLAGTTLADFPRPEALAARVLAAMNAGPGPRFARTPGDEATFAQVLSAAARVGEFEHQIRLDLATGTGAVRTGRRVEGNARRGDGGGGGDRGGSRDPEMPKVGPIELGLPATDPAALAAVFARIGRRGDPIEVRALPELNFEAERAGKSWRVRVDLRRGSVRFEPASAAAAAEAPTVRRFLLGLHLAHGYPATGRSRLAWAVIVDLMGLTMIGWGVTGLLMWWQMKNVRRSGALALAVSAAAAAALAIGMHSTITA